jgi:gamma-glutamyl AIG2-like cyclotransferase
MTEFLFSYGTLQLEAVQRTLFGRRLTGTPDELPEHRATLLESDEPAERHPIAKHTGDAGDCVAGTVFTVTLDELARADEYEPPPYQRRSVLLRSGIVAWAYLDSR